MRINPTSLEFEDLTESEADAIYAVAERIVAAGKFDWDDPIIEAWMKAANFNESQKLCTISMAFPQKALLSVARFQRVQIHTLTKIL